MKDFLIFVFCFEIVNFYSDQDILSKESNELRELNNINKLKSNDSNKIRWILSKNSS